MKGLVAIPQQHCKNLIPTQLTTLITLSLHLHLILGDFLLPLPCSEGLNIG